jgi:hypothetical protein
MTFRTIIDKIPPHTPVRIHLQGGQTLDVRMMDRLCETTASGWMAFFYEDGQHDLRGRAWVIWGHSIIAVGSAEGIPRGESGR